MIKVSALIPTYNRAKYVQRAIESVLAQTCPVDEVIVVDDGSTDGTVELIESKYGPQVRVAKQSNTGVSGARRRAISEAQGEWVAFLDSDDEWIPDRNRKLIDAAAFVPNEVGWIFGDVDVIGDGGQPNSLFGRFGLSIEGKVEVFKNTWEIHHPFQFGLLQSSIVRRKAMLEVGCFSEGLRHSEDFLVGVQVACGHRYAAIPETVTRVYRTTDLSTSSAALAGSGGPDYFRARILAYGLIARVDTCPLWGHLHARAVRGLCKVLASQGKPVAALAAQQFRFGFSLKSATFLGAAMFGHRGMRAWEDIKLRLSPDSKTNQQPYCL